LNERLADQDIDQGRFVPRMLQPFRIPTCPEAHQHYGGITAEARQSKPGL
jgi:hypothetical protein